MLMNVVMEQQAPIDISFISIKTEQRNLRISARIYIIPILIYSPREMLSDNSMSIDSRQQTVDEKAYYEIATLTLYVYI